MAEASGLIGAMSSQVEPPQELGALLEHWASLDNDAEAATVRARRTRCAAIQPS